MISPRTSIWIIGFSVLVACKKTGDTFKSVDKPQTLGEVFDSYWLKMSSNYLYWDRDPLNWDDIYKKYSPLFNTLNINNYDDNLKAATYFKQITANLIDCHYSISFQNEALQSTVINPAMDRKMKLAGFHYPYSFLKADTNYLDKGYQVGYYINPNNINDNFYITYGFIKNKIIYLSFSKFHLLKCYTDVDGQGDAKSVLNSFLAMLNNMPDNIKGIIIDVRGNGGGDIGDLNFLAGRFTDKPITFGKTRYKSNTGRLDYTPWLNAVVTPQPVANFKQQQVVVLVDNFSASLSEAFALAIRTMPKGITIGETTFGATGPVGDETSFNGGSFTVKGFLSVTGASAQFLAMDGRSYENVGITPDIQVKFNAAELNNNIDKQIEKAIEILSQ